MKKSVLLAASLVLSFVIFPLISAALNSSVSDNGFACLANKTSDCSSLSITEKIFTSLATGQCVDYVANSSGPSGCYSSPSSTSCDIKTTSQAVLSLEASGRSTNDSMSWLLSQNKSTSDINWYLQIDSANKTTCVVSSATGVSYTAEIGNDGKVTGISSGCLSPSPNGYWISVGPSCYGKQLTVSCDAPSFTVSTLYQRSPNSTYPTVYVSQNKQSASNGGTVVTSVSSYCFAPSGGSCSSASSYEATLWAALALDTLQYNVSSYLPYLTTRISDSSNSDYKTLAYSVLNIISSGYKQDLINQQRSVTGSSGSQYYWDSSVDKYFGTALALLSLQNQDSSEKDQATTWLAGVQGADGCWNSGNILDTAFILYSLFGSTSVSSSSTSTPDCSTSGGYCLSYSNCNTANGTDLGYSCVSSNYICCSKDVATPSCSSQFGQVCNLTTESCKGTPVSANDVSPSDQTCCVSGACVPIQHSTVTTDCETSGGTCQDSCSGNEVSSGASCGTGSSQVCCTIQQQYASTSQSHVGLIILLIILIILATLGIIFRKKLTPLWLKIKSKFFKGGNGSPRGPNGPRGPPGRPSFPPSRPMPFNRPMPPRSQHQVSKASAQKPKSSKEVNHVLKKLMEMSK